MDFRGTKVFDFVSASRNITVNVEKNKALQIKWQKDNLWLCNKYRELGKKLKEVCNHRQANEKNHITDKRTRLAFPGTFNRNYGWLSNKPEFQLEKYGTLMIKYPNPINEIILLGGNIPTLAGGKGFF